MLSTRAQRRARPCGTVLPGDRQTYLSEWAEMESYMYLEAARPRSCGAAQFVVAVRRDHEDAWHGLVKDSGRLRARARSFGLSPGDAQDASMAAGSSDGPGSAARAIASRRQVRRQLGPGRLTDIDRTGVLLLHKSSHRMYSRLTEAAHYPAAGGGAW